DREPEPFIDGRRALEHLERPIGCIPDPFGLEAVDGQRSFGQRIEPHANDWKDASVSSIADDAARELGAWQELLDQDRLFVDLEQLGHAGQEFAAFTDEVAL